MSATTATTATGSFDAAQARAMRRYRDACDYLALAMIYLRDNVRLQKPLRVEHLNRRRRAGAGLRGDVPLHPARSGRRVEGGTTSQATPTTPAT